MAEGSAMGYRQEYNWQELMAQWSRDMLASSYFAGHLDFLRSEYPGRYPDETVASGWLGYPPATATEIEATEKRLDLALPPDYKEFLELTNGWRAIDQFIGRLWPVEEIDWLSSTNPDYVAAWVEASSGQEEPLYESRYISKTVQISDEEYAGTAVLLLNPQVTISSGEWEAWFMSSWNPGANRYPSFWVMMQELYSIFQYVEASK